VSDAPITSNQEVSDLQDCLARLKNAAATDNWCEYSGYSSRLMWANIERLDADAACEKAEKESLRGLLTTALQERAEFHESARAVERDNERLRKSEKDIAEQMARLLATSKTGGSDCCITCAAHVLAINDRDAEIERLRAALDDAFDILKIALPGPRPWPTESDDSKLSIFRNIAEDRRPDETTGGT
jgi:hypothetical protein